MLRARHRQRELARPRTAPRQGSGDATTLLTQRQPPEGQQETGTTTTVVRGGSHKRARPSQQQLPGARAGGWPSRSSPSVSTSRSSWTYTNTKIYAGKTSGDVPLATTLFIDVGTPDASLTVAVTSSERPRGRSSPPWPSRRTRRPVRGPAGTAVFTVTATDEASNTATTTFNVPVVALNSGILTFCGKRNDALQRQPTSLTSTNLPLTLVVDFGVYQHVYRVWEPGAMPSRRPQQTQQPSCRSRCSRHAPVPSVAHAAPYLS